MTIRTAIACTLLLATLLASPGSAQVAPSPLAARAGWVVKATPHKFPDLVLKLEAAIKDNKEWKEARPAQLSVPETELVAEVRKILERHT
jgi:hypothetical protein